VLNGRKFVGIELKDSYWQAACHNLALAESKAKQSDLFAGVKADAA
jgi:hypothetical protein